MDTTNWLKQTDTPLFESLEWDKPERRDQAGRLLIIGGHQHNLNAPGKAFEYVKTAGIGSVQIALPSKVKSLVGTTLPGALFLPSTTSGEFSRDGLNDLIAHAQWADTLLLAGDVGRNSQTTLLLTDVLSHVSTPIIMTKDAIDSLKSTPEVMVNRPDTTLIASFAQIQNLFSRVNWPDPTTFNMGLVKFVDVLQRFTKTYPVSIMTLHQNALIVAVDGRVSTTTVQQEGSDLQWRTKTAAQAACYQTWYPKKPFESLTHSAFLIK